MTRLNISTLSMICKVSKTLNLQDIFDSGILEVLSYNFFVFENFYDESFLVIRKNSLYPTDKQVICKFCLCYLDDLI